MREAVIVSPARTGIGGMRAAALVEIE